MLYFDIIDVCEGIYVNTTSASKECDICKFGFLLNYRYHDLLIMFMNLSEIAILNIKCSDYRCIISLISKNKAVNLMPNSDWIEKAKHYRK